MNIMPERPYSLTYQRQENEKFADNINRYWSRFGVSANARVEEVDVRIKTQKNGFYRDEAERTVKSYEIVSSVSKFPFILGYNEYV